MPWGKTGVSWKAFYRPAKKQRKLTEKNYYKKDTNINTTPIYILRGTDKLIFIVMSMGILPWKKTGI